MSDRRGFLVPIGGAEDKKNRRTILKRFVSICGGRRARIAIIPTASHLDSTGSDYEKLFRRLDARGQILDIRSRSDCDRSWVLDEIKRADGVFMTGGHQLRLATTLGGTPVAEALRKRNKKGLHIAGTSAGASIMSTHMIGFGDDGPTPESGKLTMAPGLGFTPGLVLDQHFRQRDRLGRLLTAVSYNPEVVGIGLDEDTALFIDHDDRAEVVGSGAVTVVDPSGMEFSSMDSVGDGDPVSVIGLRVHVLVAGGTWDLATRKADAGEATARG